MNEELDALMDDTELDDAPEEVKAETVEETAPVEVEETAETTAAPESDKPNTIPLAALQDERRKRQELEAELEALKSAQPEPERPDLFVDPDAALDRIRDEAKQHSDQRWIQSCRAMVQAQYSDYGDKESVFMDLAKENPSLTQEMLKSDNPALFAYQTAQKHERYAQIKNVDEYEAKVRAEIEAKVRAEMGIKEPPDLTSAPGAGNSDLPTDDDLSALVLGDSA